MKSRRTASVVLLGVAALALVAGALLPWWTSADGEYLEETKLIGVKICPSGRECTSLSWSKAVSIAAQEPALSRTRLGVVAWSAQFTFGAALVAALTCAVCAVLVYFGSSKPRAWVFALVGAAGVGGATFLLSIPPMWNSGRDAGLYLFLLGACAGIAGAVFAGRSSSDSGSSVEGMHVAERHTVESTEPPPRTGGGVKAYVIGLAVGVGLSALTWVALHEPEATTDEATRRCSTGRKPACVERPLEGL